MIKSYKDNFESSLGAYAYLMLNQNFPHLFTVSSDNEKQKANKNAYQSLEKILTKDLSLKEMINKVKELSETTLFDTSECNDTKKKVLKTLKNIEYLNVSWDKKQSWENVEGAILYNNFSEFIKDKTLLIDILKKTQEEFGLESLSINLTSNPESFIKEFRTGVKEMCNVLDIKPKQLGLNRLEVNFNTEEGDFTGYVSNSNDENLRTHLVVKKLAVFAHEWLHFLDSSFGNKGWAYTEMADEFTEKELKIYLPEFDELAKLKGIFRSKEQNTTQDNKFTESIRDASHFFQRYALDKENFQKNITDVAKVFLDNGDKEELKDKIKELLNENYPPRYFSFIEAQCDIEVAKQKKKNFKVNQLIDFSKKADEYLGESNYTESTIELFARTFETYLHDKLKKAGKSSSLVNDDYETDMYPQGEIKKNTNAQWDKMWVQIKSAIDKQVPVEPEISKEKVISNIEKMRAGEYRSKKTYNIG